MRYMAVIFLVFLLSNCSTCVKTTTGVAKKYGWVVIVEATSDVTYANQLFHDLRGKKVFSKIAQNNNNEYYILTGPYTTRTYARCDSAKLTEKVDEVLAVAFLGEGDYTKLKPHTF